MRLSGPTALVLFTVVASSPALARNGGLYLEIAPGLAVFSTDEVVVEEGNDAITGWAAPPIAPQLKVGLNLFGWAGAEAQIAGHFWDVSGDPGGAAYVGGVVRVTPLEVLTYILPDTVQLPSIMPKGPVTWKNRPFDLGISMGGGYSIIGEDYAYQGSYFQWGFDLKVFMTPNLAIGLDFPFRHMMYEPFRYTNFSKRKGFCTDAKDAYGYAGEQKVYVEPAPRETYFAYEVTASDSSEKCTDPAPSALFFAPAFTVAGVFDFGI